MKIPKHTKIKAIHEGGCEGIAFYLKEAINVGDVIMADNVLFPDGSKPKDGTILVCNNCGKTIADPKFEVLEEA